MIYLLVFFISSFLFYLAEHIRGKRLTVVLNTIAVLLPCVLAACRDYGVGTDIMTYAVPAFDSATSIEDPIVWGAILLADQHYEPLYWWMPWVLARFTENAHWLLFTTQLLITCPTYFALKKYKKLFHIDIWFAMLLWNFALYNLGLNLMRQSIAIALLFLAAAYLFEKRYRFFVIYMLIATGFHTTGLMGCSILYMYWLLRQEVTTNSYRRARQILILVGVSALFIAISVIAFQFLMSEGLLISHYKEYTPGGSQTNAMFRPGLIIAYLLYIFIMVFHYFILIRKRVEWLFFTVLSFVFFIGQFATLISADIWRLFWYFYPFQMLALCMVERCYHGLSRCIWLASIISCTLIYWYVRFISNNYGDTGVYIFSLAK